MNFVSNLSLPQPPLSLKLRDVCKEWNDNAIRTAFIGKCGNGPSNELYLITYNSILLAKDPNSIWGTSGCNIEVIWFVDIKIEICNTS